MLNNLNSKASKQMTDLTLWPQILKDSREPIANLMDDGEVADVEITDKLEVIAIALEYKANLNEQHFSELDTQVRDDMYSYFN